LNTSKKKRKCLLSCARKRLSLAEANAQLRAECLDPVTQEDWNLWRHYYVGIVKDDPYYEHELINNDRSLAWFARETNNRRQKIINS
jgi:hypothetical protein